MKAFVFGIALLSTVCGHCWNITLEKLQEHLHSETHAWMKKRIEEDLRSFTAYGINPLMLSRFQDKISKHYHDLSLGLVRIVVDSGEIEWSPISMLTEKDMERLGSFLDALSILIEMDKQLCSLDFFVSLSDSFDRPFFTSFANVPVFTISKSRHNHVGVLYPKGLWNKGREEEFFECLQAASKKPWKLRRPIAYWRGALSEGTYPFYEWDFKPRPRLLFASRAAPEVIDAAFTEGGLVDAVGLDWGSWLLENGFVEPGPAMESWLMNRYLIAIDGYGTPEDLEWQLFSESTLLKADSKRIEWFYDLLEPYVHYVPFRQDSYDLVEKVEWVREHEKEACQIAKNAQQLAIENLTDEMVFLYMCNLLKAYAGLLKF